MAKKKEKKIYKIPSLSTQLVLPIKDFYKGIVITKDDRYIKIIEVKPITFALMSADEKRRVIDGFRQMILLAPNNIQISEITLPADLSSQLSNLDKAQEIETSENCSKVDDEYRKKLLEAQRASISRRFFISFEYERRGLRKPHISEIAQSLNNTAEVLSNTLKTMCGNDIVLEDKDNPNHAPAEILYTVLNRGENTLSFDERLSVEFNRYYEHFGERNFYMPPNDYLAPKRISFVDKRYVYVDGMYYSYYYIPSRHFSSQVFAGWLNPFINSSQGVDVNIYLKNERGRKSALLRSLTNSLLFSEADMISNDSATQAMDSALSNYASARYLKNGLNGENPDDFLYLSVLVTVYGENPEIVEARANNLFTMAEYMSVKLYPCSYLQKQAFESSLPLNKLDESIFEISKRNVLSSGAASTYPFTSFEIRDPNGIYFGDDMSTGSMTLVDIFDKKKFVNSNIFISGTSGSGKTYSLSLLAIRSRVNHIPVIIIAPEKQHEFRRVCNALGGQFIEIAPGSENRINIMEIFKPDEKAILDLEENGKRSSSYLAEKVGNLKNFFGLYLEDMTIQEKQLLDRAIMETYRRKGIALDNASLIDEASKEGKYKKMPIISDLQSVIEEMAKSNQALQRIADVIPYFTAGSGSSFDGQTNVDLNNEFIVIGLEKMKRDDLKLGMYMAMDFAWGKIKENCTEHNLLIVDEWWRLSQDKSGAEYSEEISKTIRAYGGSMVLATQQLKDIFSLNNGQYGEAVLGNCYTKILLGMTPDDADRVQNILGINDRERDEIISYRNGQCILMIGQIKMRIKFVASSFEHDLITTDFNDRIRLKSKKVEEENIDLPVYKLVDSSLALPLVELDEYKAIYDIEKEEERA